jgi:hypothetical protein
VKTPFHHAKGTLLHGENPFVITPKEMSLCQTEVCKSDSFRAPGCLTELQRLGPGPDGLIKLAKRKFIKCYAGVKGSLQPSISYSGRHGFVMGQDLLHGPADLLVNFFSSLQEQAVVGHLLREGVLEDVLPLREQLLLVNAG